MTFPFACVFAAFVLLYVSKAPVFAAMKGLGKYDNENPRDQQARLDGWGKRALAAHQNGFEGFAPFAAAVLVAHLGGGDLKVASFLAATYVVVRIAYVFLYIAGIGTLRSLVWGVGLLATAGLFLLPAFKG